MPMGPGPLGFAYFVAVKLTGYTVAAVVLKKAYHVSNHGSLKVGAIRTIIGLGAGLAYGGAGCFSFPNPRQLVQMRLPTSTWPVCYLFESPSGCS